MIRTEAQEKHDNENAQSPGGLQLGFLCPQRRRAFEFAARRVRAHGSRLRHSNHKHFGVQHDDAAERKEERHHQVNDPRPEVKRDDALPIAGMILSRLHQLIVINDARVGKR